MYEALSDRVGFVPGGVNIGVIRIDEKHCLIVDSGLNDSTARKVLRWINEAIDSEVVGILTTHGHADHFGAHAFVVKRTGARVFAPEHDAAVIRNPLLQPIFLYGGADPLDTLRSRFLLAEPSVVDEEITITGPRDFMGVDVEVVALPGHSMNQVGYLIDGVFFCADVVFPQAAIDKYRIPYLYGLTDHIASLEQARSVDAQVIIPGHGPRELDFEAPYARNREIIDEVLELVAEVIAEPVSADDVAATVFRRLDVPIADHAGYYLLRPTIAAYLAHLQRTGAAELYIDRGAALWRRT
jgi:glyoxylase-like metal-dependent hydrolase (beta-lactamase superfamily II)